MNEWPMRCIIRADETPQISSSAAEWALAAFAAVAPPLEWLGPLIAIH
jgi:hypothetical protein